MVLVERIVWGLWLGSGAFLAAVAAPAAFQSSPTSTDAANVVGAMLESWHWIATIAPLLILISCLRRNSGIGIRIVLGVALLLAGVQWMVDARIKTIRAESPVAISDLDRADPVRRRFVMMHGISSSLLLVQILCAAAVALRPEDPRSRGPASTPEPGTD